jgi:hypothetical protein
MELEKLEEEDHVLFGDRKTPLKVTSIEDDHVLVAGPNGGEYELYNAEDTDRLLVCKPGNRRYSSYADDLRKTGEWKKTSDGWKHSKTENYVKLVKNSIGFWTLETSLDSNELDLPKYGYSDREAAEEDAEKLIKKHPEGKV